MEKYSTEEILKAIRGSKRAAQGVILPLGDGNIFHIRGVHSSKETEGLTDEETFYLECCSKTEILRLRELKNSHDYLLRLRANAIADSPRACRVIAKRREQFESKGKPWSLSHYYHQKDSHHKAYIRYLNRAQSKAIKTIPSGLALIDEANAVCIRTLLGDIVIVSEGLEYFYYFMTIAFYGEQLGIEMVDRIEACLIASRIMNGTESLDFDLDPRGVLPNKIENKLNELVSLQMQFTFGHEYAHHLCGHMREMEQCSSVVGNNTQEIEVYNHDCEFEADLCAITNISNNGNAFKLVSNGAFSVLIYLNFILTLRGIIGGKCLSLSATHPHPRARVEKLHASLGVKSPLDTSDLGNMFNTSEYLADALVRRAEASEQDVFGFYGSVYLTSYTTRVREDRYEF